MAARIDDGDILSVSSRMTCKQPTERRRHDVMTAALVSELLTRLAYTRLFVCVCPLVCLRVRWRGFASVLVCVCVSVSV